MPHIEDAVPSWSLWGDVRTALQNVSSPPAARGTAMLSVTLDPDTVTVIDLTAVTYDTDNMIDLGGANPSRITINTAGKYSVKAAIKYAQGVLGTGPRRCIIHQNGTLVVGGQTNREGTADVADFMQSAVDLELAAGDFIETAAYFDGDVTLDVTEMSLSVHMFAD